MTVATSVVGARRSRPNRTLAVALMALVILAPLPLGSNRPVFWALGALLIGLVGAVYFGALAARGSALRNPVGSFRIPAALGLAYLGWLVLQIVPLGAVFGSFETTLPSGITVAHDTISIAPGATMLAAMRVAGYGLLFFLLLQAAAHQERARVMATALFLAIVAWAAYGAVALVQLGDSVLLFEKWAYEGSMTGPFVNRNSFATFLAMGFVAGVGLSLERLLGGGGGKRPDLLSAEMLRSYLVALATVLLLAALFATNSRMGVFAGLAGGTVTVGLFALTRPQVSRKAVVVAALGGLLALAMLLRLYGGGVVERMDNVDESADIRLALYEQILGLIAARPWTGWGGDTFELAFRAFRDVPVSLDKNWERAHSTYLAHWSETGLIFGSIPLLLVALALYGCIKALRRDEVKVLPAIGIGVIVTGALHSIVDFSLEMQANAWLFIAFLGIALARRPRRRRT
ncbi:O-antigen ligase family protein [Pontivivens ytuae]|uniref:O-antigen ligase family protein n=1 Tax=Pontivivens ytuae TaxID=2789856 RepID=A0A7S9LV55_9RHOB|nr:O-antigen ligase family protein [Pontivivens ytuae]QPH55839.1 O-antigen ligase family protein [Pontivivens ytuae]